MGEEISDAMNLELNLGLGPEPPPSSVNLDDLFEGPLRRFSEAVRVRARQQRRWRRDLIPAEDRLHFHMPLESQNISMVELNQLVRNPVNESALEAGEGSVAAEQRTEEVGKACENKNGVTEDEAPEKKEDIEKVSGCDGSFFDCNVCLEMARDPVVSCCGHLFCWPCLYQWLHVHSDAMECPVCKGEVSIKNVIPIYGRGNNVPGPEEDPTLKIPLRPHARRVESLRQTIHRTAFTLPVEEMIWRLGGRFDLTRDLVQPHELHSAREAAERTAREAEAAERTSTLLNRLLASRGIRRDPPQNDAMDVTQNNMAGVETRDNRRLQSLLLRRTQSNRTPLSALPSAERLVEAYFRSHPIGRNQEQPPLGDDRDSVSSIAAVINPETQVDTAVEIDSFVSLSASSSRRISDVDTGDSPAPRRRRLN